MNHNKTIADLTDEELEKEAKRFAILTGMDYKETKSKFEMLKRQGLEKRFKNEQGKEKT